MRKFLCVLLSLYIATVSAKTLASWAELPIEHFVEQSTLIVSGTFIGSTRLTSHKKGTDLIVGTIKINKVLKGSISGGTVLINAGEVSAIKVSTQINFSSGQNGLWLLNSHPSYESGLYFLDNPQQFVDTSNVATKESVEKALLKK